MHIWVPFSCARMLINQLDGFGAADKYASLRYDVEASVEMYINSKCSLTCK
jgi:hypothetical protein